MDEGIVRLASGVTVPRSALTFSASASGGPGGQHANKTATRATVRVRLDDLAGLPVDAAERLRIAAGTRITEEGELVITSDETRSLRVNQAEILERLRVLVRDAMVRPKPRGKSKPTRASVRRRLDTKARNARRKRERHGRDD
jgi:ribosome-associated protein